MSGDYKKEFANVVAIVKVSAGVQHLLWEMYQDKYHWESETSGFLVTIGHVEKMPVCLSIFCATVCHHRVLFWEATSRMVDFSMADEWLEKNWKEKQHDNHFDAGNFSRYINLYKGVLTPEQFVMTGPRVWVSTEASNDVHNYLMNQAVSGGFDRSMKNLYGQEIVGYRIPSDEENQVIFTLKHGPGMNQTGHLETSKSARRLQDIFNHYKKGL